MKKLREYSSYAFSLDTKEGFGYWNHLANKII